MNNSRVRDNCLLRRPEGSVQNCKGSTAPLVLWVTWEIANVTAYCQSILLTSPTPRVPVSFMSTCRYFNNIIKKIEVRIISSSPLGSDKERPFSLDPPWHLRYLLYTNQFSARVTLLILKVWKIARGLRGMTVFQTTLSRQVWQGPRGAKHINLLQSHGSGLTLLLSKLMHAATNTTGWDITI
jgi:hypothetical protein